MIGENDNNAPPILNVYWENENIKVATKIWKNLDATYEETLHEDAWGNRSAFFDSKVGFIKINLEIRASYEKDKGDYQWK